MKTITQENLVITTRDFLRNFSAINRKPKTKRYRVISHGQLVGTFIPYQVDPNQDWWDSLESRVNPEEQVDVKADKKRVTLKDLEKYRFRAERDLSDRIDEIVYGIKRWTLSISGR